MSSMPGFRAEESLYQTSASYAMAGAGSIAATDTTAVQPQFCVGSPCLRAPSGRLCVTLPIIGRRCVNVPRIGGFSLRCCCGLFSGCSCNVRRCS